MPCERAVGSVNDTGASPVAHTCPAPTHPAPAISAHDGLSAADARGRRAATATSLPLSAAAVAL
jgi:hypothetical protein